MIQLITLICLAVVVLLIAVYIINFLSRKKSPKHGENEAQRPRGIPVLRGDGVEAPRRGGRNVRARMRAAATRQEDDEEDLLAEDIAFPEGKVGAKKRKKLEQKAEKRKERERELEEREERKQRQAQLEELRKKEELKEKEEEKRKEEEEKALKEEEARKEHEEYLKLKESFAVEEEGFDQDENVEEGNKFQEFIDYIKGQKVVLLEDLASRFKLKTQEAIDRVQELLAQEWLVGVIDDRGKFIYITKEELESVAQFIRQRGRVSIAELVDHSNTLINLQPEEIPVTS
ncbi:DDRGK domain-containing protein 1-like [Uloborus diversus]|uniref:DDRGK domain-containing protein 1-like n=1 Tax=Uloborus diversus TaxID=327109 RepID=UPI00240951F1|nr:DDRGK domain-containing protein 1-like [Uloborus diversus]